VEEKREAVNFGIGSLRALSSALVPHSVPRAERKFMAPVRQDDGT